MVEMRRVLLIGLPSLFVLLSGGALWYRLSWHGDALQAARLRMQHGDMKGAELYLRDVVRKHPENAEAAFRLGTVDLALGNPSGGELELRRARAHGYPARAIILPLAQAMLEQRHAEAVLQEFVTAQQPPGGRAAVLSVRASAELLLHDFDAAAASSAAAEAAAPDDPDVLLTAARVALDRGDLAGAASRADHLLRLTPGQADALLLKADIALRSGDARASLAFDDTVLAAAPKRLDAHMARARALAALGRDDEARHTVEEVLRSAPKDVNANYLLTMLALRHGDYPAAEGALGNLSPIIGQLPRGLYYLAIAKLGVGQSAQAEEAATKFLAQAPGDQEAIRLMAFVEVARGHAQAAMKLLAGIVAGGHADADTLDLYGRAQAMAGDMRAASQSLASASVLAPRDTAILDRLAAAKLGLGEREAAEADLSRSLQLQPAQPAASEALVRGALARGDLVAAQARVDQLAHAVGDTEAVSVLAAEIRIAAYDLDRAQSLLQGVLTRFPDSRPAVLGLVRVATMRGDSATARSLLEDRLRRHADDLPTLDLLLPALFAIGQTQEAVRFAEAAHAAAAGSPAVTAALAESYVRAGAPARAAALLDRAGAQDDPALERLRAEALTLDHHPKEAGDIYARLLEQAPADSAVRRSLALLQSDGDPDHAMATLQEGLKLTPGNPQLMGALVALDLKAHGIAAALATAATLQTDARNQPAAGLLPGEAWAAAKDPARAASTFLASFQATPTQALALRAAASLSGVGRVQEAEDLLTRWVSTHGDDSAAQSMLAGIEIGAHRLDAAGPRLEAVVAARPTDAAALNNLAWIDMQQGRLEQAAALARRAYVLAPAPAVADTLGWILVKQNESAQALPLLQLASSRDAADQGARRYHYAYALAAAGRKSEALPVLKQAMEGSKPFDDEQAAKTLLDQLSH